MTEKFLTEPQKQFFAEFEKLSGQKFEDAIPRISREIHRLSLIITFENGLQSVKELGNKSYLRNIMPAVTAVTRAASESVSEYFSETRTDREGFLKKLAEVYDEAQKPLLHALDSQTIEKLREKPFVGHTIASILKGQSLSNEEITRSPSYEDFNIGLKGLASGKGQDKSSFNVFKEILHTTSKSSYYTIFKEAIKMLCNENNPSADFTSLLTALDRSFLSQKELDTEAKKEAKRQAALAEKAAAKNGDTEKNHQICQ